HPWEREAAAGGLELPTPSPRPDRIVNVADVEVEQEHRASIASDWRDLGRGAGSERTGLVHVTVLPGMLNVAPHCHSGEEELFVVLDGAGALEMTPSPRSAADGGERSQH